ncbi:O-antigen ligase family protein [Erythrobacter insulae]|uniref:O-antigen ligase family protein n=1 Tax=Erythrobacter insulae TaxID=2584124 RepID=UPI00163D64AF|nr:O-antigen ligase family protein [Erythrobacter insulae]
MFATLLLIAVIIGGGGVRYGIANLIVQLCALLLLAVRGDSVLGFWRQAPLSLRAVLGLSICVPLIQIIPLPESVWSILPGRELVQQSFALTGRSGWAPISVDPVRTAVALTGMIVPIAVVTAGWTAKRRHLVLLGWVVVGLGLLNVCIGIPQVLSGGTAGRIYAGPSATGILYGTFANRNSTGLLLVSALSLAAMLPAPKPHHFVLPARITICALLMTAIILTRSRTALVLAAIPVALVLLKMVVERRNGKSGPRRSNLFLASAVLLGLGAVTAVLTIAPGRVNDTVERFQTQSDARSYIWEDSLYSASRYWPVGAGMGTFDEVFQTDESLENATERRAGRAHNDYLEIAIEAGLPGLILIALWLILTGWFAWRARHSQLRWMAWAAASILLAIALQSITDYPLRNQAMLGIAAFALLLLARIAERPEEEASP